MKLPLAPRSEVELAQFELDEWRRRAESRLGDGDPLARSSRPGRRRRRLRRLGSLVAAFVVTGSVALASFAMPGRTHSAASPDVPACIGKARYENPIRGNQYQELVNALYVCGVYRSP
jgi:hypothetical protein